MYSVWWCTYNPGGQSKTKRCNAIQALCPVSYLALHFFPKVNHQLTRAPQSQMLVFDSEILKLSKDISRIVPTPGGHGEISMAQTLYLDDKNSLIIHPLKEYLKKKMVYAILEETM